MSSIKTSILLGASALLAASTTSIQAIDRGYRYDYAGDTPLPPAKQGNYKKSKRREKKGKRRGK